MFMWANSLIKNIVKRSILKVYKVYFFISKLKKNVSMAVPTIIIC